MISSSCILPRASLPPASPASLASSTRAQSGELSDHHVFSVPKEGKLDADTLLIPRAHTLWATKLGVGAKLHRRRRFPSHAQPPPPPRAREGPRLGQANRDAVRAQARVASQLGISDPRFKSQWHLMNTVQPGNDLNVSGVWLEGVFGEGVTTAIVDDGLDFHNLDLSPNYYAGGSYDFNVGVAYRSRVSGIRMLSGTVDDVDQAAAMNFDYQNNDIYSCSWGPEDDGRHMKAPGVLVQRAMVNGVQRGRGGRGSIYVFSAGNGAGQDDDCNFDGRLHEQHLQHHRRRHRPDGQTRAVAAGSRAHPRGPRGIERQLHRHFRGTSRRKLGSPGACDRHHQCSTCQTG